MKKRTRSNLRTSVQTLVLVIGIVFVMAFACNDGGDTPVDTGGDTPKRAGNNPQLSECGYQKGIGKKYGTREPRICTDTKAPATGAITAALAKKYFEGQKEGESQNTLGLVEDVDVEVGNGLPYGAIRGQYSLTEIDVNQPVYPIRGSYTRYRCVRIYEGDTESKCDIQQIKAQGYCYKTTFGDWRCDY